MLKADIVFEVTVPPDPNVVPLVIFLPDVVKVVQDPTGVPHPESICGNPTSNNRLASNGPSSLVYKNREATLGSPASLKNNSVFIEESP